jgi:ABC-type multidrug transport system fused ATPase/permease subunit
MAMPPLWTRRRSYRLARLLLIGVLQATAAVLLAVAGSYLLTGSNSFLSSEALAGGVLIGTISLIGLRVLQRRWSEALALSYILELRLALMSHVLRTPTNVKSMRFGLVMTRIVNDLTAIKLWIANGLIASLVAISVLGTLLAYLLVMEPTLVAALVPGLLLWSVCLLATLRPLMDRIRESRRRRGRIAAIAGGQLSGRLALLTHGAFSKSLKALRKRSRKMNRALIGRATISGLLRSSSDLVFPVIAVTLGLGLLTFDGTPITAYRLGFFFLLLGIVIVQLNALSMAVEYRMAHTVAMARLKDIFSRPAIEVNPGKRRLSRKAGGRRLKVRNLDLGPANPRYSLEVKPGQTVVLEDLTSGEITSLFNQVTGLAQLAKGRISIDGKAQLKTPPRDWWRSVTLVSNEMPLVSGTVADNATLGAPSHLEDQERQKALHQFGLTGEIAATRISETAQPSQSVAAAIRATRGILRRANIVLVDEAVQRQLDQDDLLEVFLEALEKQGATCVLAPFNTPANRSGLIPFPNLEAKTAREQDL